MKRTSSITNVFSLRDFRLLFAGATTSILGDQFALIATPWLVLKLSNDPLALGIVLALEGIPRAAFMLLGGAITDRFSPRIIMLLSDSIRFILTGLMALVVFGGFVQMWMLYVFGLAFGLVAGFAIPAENSMVPMLVAEADLQAGNSVMMGATQLVSFVGPTLAGILIGGYSQPLVGIGLAFAIDALSFLVSAVCLWLLCIGPRPLSADGGKEQAVWSSIASGMRFLWGDRTFRLIFMIVAAMNFLFVGPLMVGIPLLAKQRLTEGALAFGLLMSAYAGGNLAGYLLAGTLPRPRGRTMRAFLLALLAAFGVALGAMGLIRSTWVDFGLMLMLGLGNGYIGILLFTWLQSRTPKEMLGRVMSIVMLSSIGLVPVSQAISGAACKWSLTFLFAAAGACILLVTLWAAPRPELVTFSESMLETHPAEGVPVSTSTA